MTAAIAFFEGFLFSLSLCFDLGMVNLAIMKTGMERGFKPSFMIGFGSCFGDLFYLSLALLGVSVIFEYEAVKWTLWIAGTIILSYLTYKMLRDGFQSKNLDVDGATVVYRSSWRDFLAGAGLAMASPTVIAWFAFAAGPILAGTHMKHEGGLPYFVAGFFVAGLLWSVAVAMISSLTGHVFRKSMVRVLSFLSGLLFLYFAVRVFLNGLNDVLG